MKLYTICDLHQNNLGLDSESGYWWNKSNHCCIWGKNLWVHYITSFVDAMIFKIKFRKQTTTHKNKPDFKFQLRNAERWKELRFHHYN